MLAMRKTVMEIHNITSTRQFADKKIESAYNYIFGGEFGQNLEQIILSYNRDRALLEQEKETMMKLWGERDTRINSGKNAALQLLGGIKEIKAIGDGVGTLLLEENDIA